MTPTTAALILSLVGMFLVAGLVAFALHSKGNVKASGRIGSGAFSIETTEKRK